MRLLLLLLAAAVVCSADDFPQTCNPFGANKVVHPIDNSCGLEGATNATTASKEQDKAKNNFCASDPAKRVTTTTLRRLQTKVDAVPNFEYGNLFKGRPGPPAQRDMLKNLPPVSGATFAEGDLVYFIGYITEVKPGGKESVNCGQTGKENVDIHLALSATKLNVKKKDPQKNAKLCANSFVAEVIPHLRPDEMDAAFLRDLKDDPVVKVTGALTFDASHEPCNETTPNSGDPARFTEWEIHPVYKIEVCKLKTIAGCASASAAQWETVEEWENEPDPDEE